MQLEFRTHHCGQLRDSDIGKTVRLQGWVATRRDHGGLVFVDLRDRFGLTQVVFDAGESTGAAPRIRNEFVIGIRGKVRARPGGMANTKLATGAIEVAADFIEILSEAKTPPFPIDDDGEVTETLRLKYRYLDLRRPSLQRNLAVRSRALGIIRGHLAEQDFLEIETPILYKSTPEGARDFIVPSRVHPGMFYALPQSPQTLKQLLMISGMDRYYQIARCFRDEDLRADRQPEFTQIDIETSFMREEDLFPIMESMMAKLWKEILGVTLTLPFPRMTYEQAMTEYGSDKPDVRFDLKIKRVTEVFKGSEFKAFSSVVEGGEIRAIRVPAKADQFSRKDLDELSEEAVRYGAKGLLWIKVSADGTFNSPAAKFFKDAERNALSECLSLQVGDLVLLVADLKDSTVCNALGALRLTVAKKLNMIPDPLSGPPAFLWVHRFPLLQYDDKERRYYACHHPFTMPAPNSVEGLMKGEKLEKLEAAAYDMVLNGVEVGGGSLRIYRSDIQSAMFKALGMTAEDAQAQFGFFLEALQYGTPPHGGIAFGVERLTALLCGVGPIRDVMAFPKTQKGQCLMSDSPSVVRPEQLVELGISIRKPTS